MPSSRRRRSRAALQPPGRPPDGGSCPRAWVRPTHSREVRHVTSTGGGLSDDTLAIYRKRINDIEEGVAMRSHARHFWAMQEGRFRGFGFTPPFPPPGQGHHGRGRGRSRGSRPNVRNAVLALLVERPMHGYEMIQELESRTGGIWRPSPGSVYPTL